MKIFFGAALLLASSAANAGFVHPLDLMAQRARRRK